MPEVTDLMRVAQYVKSDKAAPSDVYNAACRLLDQLASEGRPARLKLITGNGMKRRPSEELTPIYEDPGPNREGCDDPDCSRTECLHLGICWEDALWAEGPTGNALKKTTESHRDGRTPQTLGTPEGQGVTEAQGGSE